MCEDRNQKHQGHHAEVLEKKDRHHDATRRAVQLHPVGVDLQNNRRRGQGNQRSIEQRLVPRDFQPNAGSCRGRDDSAHHLEPAPLEHKAPQPYDASQGKLEADREKKEHDAELRQFRHRVGPRDEREPMRTDDDSCHEEPGDGGQPGAVGEGGDGDRYR